MDDSVGIHIHFFLSARMKYERVCEHVIVLDACYTIKRPTTMSLAKTRQNKETNKNQLFCPMNKADKEGAGSR